MKEKLITRRPEEYQIGQLYYIQDADDPTKFIITICNGIADSDRIKGRYLSNFEGTLEFGKEESTPYVTKRPSRLADKEEINWYKACIRADKFVPRNSTYPGERVIPTEKSYVITEYQLHTIHDLSNPVIKEMLENWFHFYTFHEKVGGNGK